MTTLKASRPTLEAFAPYGTLLTKPLGTSTLERPDITYWHGTADLADLGSSGVTGYLSAYQREAILHSIERHRQTCEVFIPLLGRSLFVVAPPGEPDMALARAFVLEPGSSILLHKGTWHWAPFPLTPTADFLLLLRRETVEQDIEMVEISPHRLEAVMQAPPTA